MVAVRTHAICPLITTKLDLKKILKIKLLLITLRVLLGLIMNQLVLVFLLETVSIGRMLMVLVVLHGNFVVLRMLLILTSFLPLLFS